MTKQREAELRAKYDAWNAKARELLTVDVVEKFLAHYGGDGHTIADAACMVREGIPEHIVAGLTMSHKSDTGDPKSTIFGPDGSILPTLTGVYLLTASRSIAFLLDVDYEPALGRGFEARNIARALRAWCVAQRQATANTEA